MQPPEVWSIEELCRAELPSAALWVIPPVRERAQEKLGLRASAPLSPLPAGTSHLIVIGGGSLLDEAKAHLHRRDSGVELIAVPSIWGSGAEVSPFAVLNRDGKKEVLSDPALVPRVRVTWPELAASLPLALARDACGDSWAHALEGFLSPLATDDLRGEVATLMGEMLALGPGRDPAWFELSARACAAQARSGVGLVHGMAHQLEGALRGATEAGVWGHAALCSNLLWPVMRFNRSSSGRFDELLARHGLDPEHVLTAVRELHDPDRYAMLLPAMQERWSSILRDPCTRTNSALVRAKDLDCFLSPAGAT